MRDWGVSFEFAQPRSLGRLWLPLSGRHFAPTPSKSAKATHPPKSTRGVNPKLMRSLTVLWFSQFFAAAPRCSGLRVDRCGEVSFTDLEGVGANPPYLSGSVIRPSDRGCANSKVWPIRDTKLALPGKAWSPHQEVQRNAHRKRP